MSAIPGRELPVSRGTDLGGLRATVMGLGRFSGGVETVRWLAKKGARVTVTDLKAEAELADPLEEISGLDVRLRLGGHAEEDFTGADLVVASPAVPPRSRFLHLAAAAGTPLVTELTLTMRLLAARTVWVTGTCGKSTTTALLGEILTAAGHRVRVGGNIGRALLGVAEETGPEETAVLEVSSFQLEWMARDGIVPDLAVVTNVTPNHLDWHGEFESYLAAKAAAVPPAGIAVLNADDPVSRERLAALPCAERRWVSLDDPPPPEIADLRLPGEFNRMNALQAAAAARLLGVEGGAVRAAIGGFRGLPHRLEDVGERGGVRGINDSKATTPEAAMRAIRALDGPIVLIAGGYERGADLEELSALIRERVRAAILLGQSADRLAAAIGSGGPEVVLVPSVEEAVDLGLGRARPGDTLLLSPGHASWDMFASYEERGGRFRARFLASADPAPL